MARIMFFRACVSRWLALNDCVKNLKERCDVSSQAKIGGDSTRVVRKGMIVVRIRKDGGNGRREIGRRVRTADGEVAVNAIQQPLRDAAHGERRGGNATGSTLKSDEAEWLRP